MMRVRRLSDDLNESDGLVDDSRVRLVDVATLLDEEVVERWASVTWSTSQVVRDEILTSLLSMRRNFDQPSSVLHALLLRDRQSSAMIAAAVDQDPDDVESILKQLVEGGLVYEVQEYGSSRFTIDWPRRVPLNQD
jgi:hypothetical protein